MGFSRNGFNGKLIKQCRMAEFHMKAGDDHDFKCCFKGFTLQLVSRKQSYFSLSPISHYSWAGLPLFSSFPSLSLEECKCTCEVSRFKQILTKSLSLEGLSPTSM